VAVLVADLGIPEKLDREQDSLVQCQMQEHHILLNTKPKKQPSTSQRRIFNIERVNKQ